MTSKNRKACPSKLIKSSMQFGKRNCHCYFYFYCCCYLLDLNIILKKMTQVYRFGHLMCVYEVVFLTMNNFHWIFNMYSDMSECILPSVLFYINAIYRYIYCGDHLINCWSFFQTNFAQHLFFELIIFLLNGIISLI